VPSAAVELLEQGEQVVDLFREQVRVERAPLGEVDEAADAFLAARRDGGSVLLERTKGVGLRGRLLVRALECVGKRPGVHVLGLRGVQGERAVSRAVFEDVRPCGDGRSRLIGGAHPLGPAPVGAAGPRLPSPLTGLFSVPDASRPP
jgi:hypothetical protein